MKIFFLVPLLLQLIPSTSAAQQEPPQQSQQVTKQLVTVTQSGEGPVGIQLAFAVREALRRSASFELVSSPQDALFHIELISLDPDSGISASDGRRTAAAVIYTMKNWIPFKKHDPQTWYPIFLNAIVVTVGSNRVDDIARSIVATLDEAVERVKRDLRGD